MVQQLDLRVLRNVCLAVWGSCAMSCQHQPQAARQISFPQQPHAQLLAHPHMGLCHCMIYMCSTGSPAASTALLMLRCSTQACICKGQAQPQRLEIMRLGLTACAPAGIHNCHLSSTMPSCWHK